MADLVDRKKLIVLGVILNLLLAVTLGILTLTETIRVWHILVATAVTASINIVLNAARMAMGLEANVTVVDRSVRRLQELDALYGDRLDTVYSTVEAINSLVRDADVVVGAVLVAGAEAPKLVTRAMLGDMQRGAVIVDVAIDQGGCTETSKATTHDDPTYVVDDIVHYCVANMPGAVARTSTFALNNATLPFTVALADKGYKQALLDDPHLLQGLNVHEGKITYEAVAKDLGYDYHEAASVLG